MTDQLARISVSNLSHLSRLVALSFLIAAVSSCAADSDADDPADDDDDDYEQSSSELSTPGSWVLPGDVNAAGQGQFVRYDDAGPWRGAAGCGGGILAGTRELGDHLRRTFAGSVSSYGGYSCRPNTANRAKTSVHGTGRALDVFIPLDRGQADNGKGDQVANWLVRNAAHIGVQLVIWDRTIWTANRSGQKARGYTGPHPHHDHIHVELNNDGAARRTGFFNANCGPGKTIGWIDAHYQSLGGCRSFLGAPTTNELATPDGVGRYNYFERGAIYFRPDLGPHEIHGEIWKLWTDLKREQGNLGYPTSDEIGTPDRVGAFSNFERGSIYWHPRLGPHEVRGAIRGRWAATGYERGPLGYPTSNEYAVPNNGAREDFEHGSIVCDLPTGNTTVIMR